ncbi:hypothetical protein CR513_22612, partial [Mucuna pruriens]
MVNEIGAIDNLRLENQLTELTSLVRQLAVGQHQASIATKVYAGSENLPSQTIPNLRGNASAVSLRSGREIPQVAPQERLRETDADFELDADSQAPQPNKYVPLSFPTRTLSARKPEFDEELLKMFWKVEINIPLLDAIKQIPKYAKFLKELCVHKRKNMKGRVELGGIVSVLTRNDDIIAESQQALQKNC